MNCYTVWHRGYDARAQKKKAEANSGNGLTLMFMNIRECTQQTDFQRHYLLPTVFRSFPVISSHPQVSDKEIVFENKTHVAHSGSAA